MLFWKNRCNSDDRTLVAKLSDEINELDLAVSLQQLIELLGDTVKHTNKRNQKLIKSQLQQWIAVCSTISRYICLFQDAKFELILYEIFLDINYEKHALKSSLFDKEACLIS